MKLPGLNIQAPWARLLLDGSKTIETRTYPLPLKFECQAMWLIETPGSVGKFRARVIGIIRFSGNKRYYSAADFYDDEKFHLIRSSDLSYAWKNGTPKYGWFVEMVQEVSFFDPPFPRGIIYSRPFARK